MRSKLPRPIAQNCCNVPHRSQTNQCSTSHQDCRTGGGAAAPQVSGCLGLLRMLSFGSSRANRALSHEEGIGSMKRMMVFLAVFGLLALIGGTMGATAGRWAAPAPPTA